MNTENEENKNRSIKIKIGLFILAAFVVGWIFGALNARVSLVGYTPRLIERNLAESQADFSVFWRAWDLLVEYYDGNVDYTKMIQGAIRGMTEALGDPYTAFLSREEAELLNAELSGVIYGIGAEIGIKNDELTIVTVLPGTPAERSGLMSGDVIWYIDNESTEEMILEEAIFKIRGKEGTEVTLEIKRNGERKEHKIKRAKIVIESVTSKIVEGNVGVINVVRFDENTTSSTREILDGFISKNVEKIVLDLRNNPGGYFDQSISLTSEFVKEGVAVREKREVGGNKKSEEYRVSGNGRMTGENIRIVVLINEGSASAAEIVAGALKDHKRATLVGNTTFGKGSVQEIKNLSDGALMRITIAHWYTPNGTNINEKGVEPHHIVDMTEEDFDKNKDPQLEKALQLLK